MYYFNIFIKLIPFLIQAIKAAEIFFQDQPASGAEKKESVKTVAKAIMDGAMEASTGGQKETLEKLDPLVDKAIDVGVAFLFPK